MYSFYFQILQANMFRFELVILVIMFFNFQNYYSNVYSVPMLYLYLLFIEKNVVLVYSPTDCCNMEKFYGFCFHCLFILLILIHVTLFVCVHVYSYLFINYVQFISQKILTMEICKMWDKFGLLQEKNTFISVRHKREILFCDLGQHSGIQFFLATQSQ